MEIILRGQHSGAEAIDNFVKIFQLFQERYHIKEFQEIHLSVTLLDEQGEIVELVDNKSDQAYRVIEILSDQTGTKHKQKPSKLHLVVDNTQN
jgi:hypothetical protein